jgi:hypothetical protein
MKLIDRLTKDRPIDNTKAPSYLKIWWENNSLRGQNEEYKKLLKEEAFKTLMTAVGEPERLESLNREIKNLRDKNRVYKRIIKETHEKSNERALKRKLIYICSPLAGDIDNNIKKAIGYCKKAINEGKIPIAPHVYLTRILDDTIPGERETGMTYGMELLKLCDELWVFGSPSTGMKKEIEWWINNTDRKIIYYYVNGKIRKEV